MNPAILNLALVSRGKKLFSEIFQFFSTFSKFPKDSLIDPSRKSKNGWFCLTQSQYLKEKPKV